MKIGNKEHYFIETLYQALYKNNLFIMISYDQAPVYSVLGRYYYSYDQPSSSKSFIKSFAAHKKPVVRIYCATTDLSTTGLHFNSKTVIEEKVFYKTWKELRDKLEILFEELISIQELESI